ncbi:UDP-2,4-diacetamido-2,4,6-trideoxy-beta-L-altropyranose hydrolase [Aquincola tertiaricarbonis]|uniref:UDP-2,4-diacetamido-2,4, 6-trideoxy-beta-L-altropyranose hydrolase n=1 Tax=Aquincola tertiaricarbonis TaxID=391953 RepID=A0ABY4S064_AQUTE|nr:UDP-2,4-diacetamido-2,4,6-trideoxy-beta-L-altropyranose hydrolase [Aquincola tertiaricarbonis]URI06322.1 UDP-2,4-diacetamido-2,4,6-trideoxy-beta-L-altropyranose hydrolase [Aquincola tertiaricarbonis]
MKPDVAPVVLALRADASTEVGSGHVMRCLALAEAAEDLGQRAVFVCRALPGDLRGEISARGFEVLTLPLDAQTPWTPERDAQATLQALATLAQPPRWLLVDHYGLGADWHRSVAASGAAIAVLDDLADRPLQARVLIDQNAVTTLHRRYPALVPPDCQLLLGPQYTLLRRDVRLAAQERAAQSRQQLAAGPVLLFLGGADADGLTLQVLDHLPTAGLAGPLQVLAGAMNPHQAALRSRCQALGHGFEVARRDMRPLLARTRAAVVACGMFAVELQALGVPCLLLPLSDIQRQVAEHFSRHGRALLLQADRIGEPRALARALDQLMTLPFEPGGDTAVAPDGARRVVQHLIESAA